MLSREDGYISVPDARRLYRAAGARERRLYIFLGSYRGWDLLNAAPYKECASRILLDFLRG
jgi:hypothetical protein